MSTMTHEESSIDLSTIYKQFPSGVVALAATVDGQPNVLVASSFSVGVSEQPPLVMLAVQKTSSTWPKLKKAQEIGISILGKGHDKICRQLSSRDTSSRLKNVAFSTQGEAILVDDAAGYFVCRLHEEHAAGDHTIVVLEVINLEPVHEIDPLIYYRSNFTSVRTSYA